MPIERWTNKKLNRLAGVVSQLTIQVQQMQLQMVHLSDRVDRTCNSLDGLVNALQNVNSTQTEQTDAPEQADPAFKSRSQDLRLQQLEQQLQQLRDRVQVLEQQERPFKAPPTQPIFVEDDGIEDEPDEILWDFLEPSERMNRS